MTSKSRPPLRLIAGPCVIESRDMAMRIADYMAELTARLGIEYIFKASYDKANRSSSDSFRGPGCEQGLEILSEVRNSFGVRVLTDIHESQQAELVSQAVDILQIPAFLCRQTDLLESAALAIQGTEKCLNVKKGQFLAPWDMAQVVNKLSRIGLNPESGRLWLTERGSCFGYNTLVVDFRSLPEMQKLGCPIIFDATHSVQQPGGRGSSSGGQREHVGPLARAAMAIGVDGLFMEMHPNPDEALSDGPNMVPLYRVENLLKQLLAIRAVISEGTASSCL